MIYLFDYVRSIGIRFVGIVRSQTLATEFSLLLSEVVYLYEKLNCYTYVLKKTSHLLQYPHHSDMPLETEKEQRGIYKFCDALPETRSVLVSGSYKAV
jgi:hypothetical protein